LSFPLYIDATPGSSINIEKHLNIFDWWLCSQHAFHHTHTSAHIHTYTQTPIASTHKCREKGVK